MPDTRSPAEIAATVSVTLIALADQRQERIHALSTVVTQAVMELDPEHRRDHSPTWWQDLPAWQSLDSFDRFRRAHDQLVVLEVQAKFVTEDLRGGFALAPVGTPRRPVGYSPQRALTVLMQMALRRAEMLDDMEKAERLLRPKLRPETARGVRAQLRMVRGQEDEAHDQFVRLQELLTAPSDLRHTG